MKNFLIITGVVLALGFSGLTYFSVQKAPEQPIGAASNDFYTPAAFYDSVVMRNPVATTSLGSAITVSAADFRQWSKSSVVSYTPNLLTETLTFPASSTIADVVPRPGDRAFFCLRNATSTASAYVTFAGGTGTNLLVATTTVNGTAGAKILVTGKVACFQLVREAATATTYDIDVLMQAYQ